MKIVRSNQLHFEAASHEDRNSPGVWKKVFFRKDDLPSGHTQMVNWAKLPVNSAFRAHFHEDMTEIFIILSGKVEIEVAGEKAELQAGDAVLVPERAEHVMRNVSSEDVHYIALGISRGVGGKTVVTQ